MRRVSTFKNVFFDVDDSWNITIEPVFLVKVFEHIKCLVDDFDDYTVYIFPNNIDGIRPSSITIDNPKKILYYISNESCNVDYLMLSKHYFLVVANYFTPDETSPNNCITVPLGYVEGTETLFNTSSVSQKKSNVFFSGTLNSNRISFFYDLLDFKIPSKAFYYIIATRNLYVVSKKVLNFFKRKLNEKYPTSNIFFNEEWSSGLSKLNYSKLLNESFISLSPKGYTNVECLRIFESMMYGCVVITEKLPDRWYYTNSPIIQVDNWRQGRNIILSLIKNKEKMIQIGNATLDWWNNVCNEKGTAKVIAEKINELVKSKN